MSLITTVRCYFPLYLYSYHLSHLFTLTASLPPVVTCLNPVNVDSTMDQESRELRKREAVRRDQRTSPDSLWTNRVVVRGRPPNRRRLLEQWAVLMLTVSQSPFLINIFYFYTASWQMTSMPGLYEDLEEGSRDVATSTSLRL